MNKTGIHTFLSHFARTLQEVEDAVRQSYCDLPEPSRLAPQAPMPDHWREVFHMARIAPALLDCLQECNLLIEELHSLNARTGQVPLTDCPEEQAYQEGVANLMEHCRQVMTVAMQGAPLSRDQIH